MASKPARWGMAGAWRDHRKTHAATPGSRRLRLCVTSLPKRGREETARQIAGYREKWPNWANAPGKPPAKLRGGFRQFYGVRRVESPSMRLPPRTPRRVLRDSLGTSRSSGPDGVSFTCGAAERVRHGLRCLASRGIMSGVPASPLDVSSADDVMAKTRDIVISTVVLTERYACIQ